MMSEISKYWFVSIFSIKGMVRPRCWSVCTKNTAFLLCAPLPKRSDDRVHLCGHAQWKDCNEHWHEFKENIDDDRFCFLRWAPFECSIDMSIWITAFGKWEELVKVCHSFIYFFLSFIYSSLSFACSFYKNCLSRTKSCQTIVGYGHVICVKKSIRTSKSS
jgi:hypothetical protein